MARLRRGAKLWILPKPVALFIAVMSVASIVVLATVLSALVYRFAPPPLTPLMLIRSVSGDPVPVRQKWVPYRRLSPHLVRAVIAAEDARFCRHRGFDWTEIKSALRKLGTGKRMRGASTLSNQTAKNVFLWPGRSFVRKGLEAYYTVLIEALWGKRRIMEVYLNVAEWGRGIYGAEAAARHYFGRSARHLTPRQATLLAAALPNPRNRVPAQPSTAMVVRASMIARRTFAVSVGRRGPCPNR